MKQLKQISFRLLLTMVLAGALFTSCRKEEEGNTHINADGVTGTVTDIDGNTYAIVKIGEQWWMAENLKVTKYKDGTAIPNVTDVTEWSNLTTDAYASYDNDDSYITKYGLLYNWHTVNTGKLAPEGWHVPTSAEWDTLSTYVSSNPGTSGYTAKALASTTDWSTSGNTGAIGNDLSINNSTGFSAFPAGYRIASGSFGGMSNYGYWWSTTVYDTGVSLCFCLRYSNKDHVNSYAYQEIGFSVRCVMD